ncbi:MAG: tRNA (adenosine(37)-N6)-threonylcarbamoyltransferase complex dimerization subunit type 1 TsaB [Rubrobacteraceae bacterium]
MLTLAFDASTPVVTVALACVDDEDKGREILTEASISSRGASEALLPAVDAVLELAGERLDSVGRILVGVGPGTFTGIRIAVSTARAVALGSGIPLSVNSTLAALAAPALLGGPRKTGVLAVLDARRHQVFAQRFSNKIEVGEVFCTRPEDLSIDGGHLLVGDGALRYRETLSTLGYIPPDDSPLHRVTALGHLISADLHPVDPSRVVPFYVREPDAEVRRDLNPWSRA